MLRKRAPPKTFRKPSRWRCTPPPTSSGPSTVSPGVYDCTSGGAQIGTATFAGRAYRTSTGATGTYQYDASTGDISFAGGDLGDFTGTYDPSGPSMELTSLSGGDLHCAQWVMLPLCRLRGSLRRRSTRGVPCWDRTGRRCR